MHHLAMPMGMFASADAAQSALHSGGRFLLMIAMTLFLSYLLFMVGAVVVSWAAGRGRRPAAQQPQPVPGTADPGASRAVERPALQQA